MRSGSLDWHLRFPLDVRSALPCFGWRVKLDYRDSLVDFEYDPKRVNPFAR